MTQPVTQRWLDIWGYSQAPKSLHLSATSVPGTHAYRPELEALLDPQGAIRATAVFDVDGIPTVCFIEDDGRLATEPAALDRIRQKIWNQNLISVVLVVDDHRALAAPVIRGEFSADVVPLRDAHDDGVYSRADLQSGGVFARHADWFNPNARVDQDLLHNLGQIVGDLTDKFGLGKLDAQYLMAQVLFVSYLEHRGIVSDIYRAKHQVDRLEHLVRATDRRGITKLLNRLDADFNGDFLKPETQGSTLWQRLPDQALERLKQFLLKTDLESGQTNFWSYDFRYIPVELISGIYESFLSEEKSDVGAYYTPRHLANLVVDQAFARSQDLLSEKIYDGACGSGILLTTAYRRMLAYAEAKANRPLDFGERSTLLQEHIFGSDVSDSACQVTAFSLYLSMLERLRPADIAELQDNDKVKLPTLSEKNIKGGPEHGDFFSTSNPFAAAHACTIFLSNPPWVEPEKEDWLTSDEWAKNAGIKIPRRQTAGAFMLHALDSVAPGGRLCLILPISVLAAPTSRAFLKTWLDRCRLETLINFGDLRKLLFNSARQPCVVAILSPRAEDATGKIPGEETFEYWVPKADVSFAFGRLTLHASDRHVVQTQALQKDNELLTSLFWGTPWDVAMITRLRLLGTLGDLIGKEGKDGEGNQRSLPLRDAAKKPWRSRKGFHMKDASVEVPDSSRPLWRMHYLNAKKFEVNGPVLDPSLLVAFPRNKHPTVAKLSSSLMKVFKGPRIVFTDGMSKDRSIRAAFSNEPFCFSSSMGVISGGDEDILRFVAAYLHSDLVRYLLMLTAYQVNFERERVTLADIRRLPFLSPTRHVDPKRAWAIVKKVATITRQLERRRALLRQDYDGGECEGLFAEYFGLGERETARIREVAHVVAPNLQPNSYAALNTTLQRRPTPEQVESYTRELVAALRVWRDARRGQGDFQVTATLGSESAYGPFGILRLDVRQDARGRDIKATEITVGDQAVRAVLQTLSAHGLLPLKLQEDLYLATDVVVRHGDSLYLIKPLLQRLWLQAEAYRDAERVVGAVLSSGFDAGMEANG